MTFPADPAQLPVDGGPQLRLTSGLPPQGDDQPPPRIPPPDGTEPGHQLDGRHRHNGPSALSRITIGLASMHLAELKAKTPSDLLSYAESLQIENASSLRKQDMMFAILKNLAENDQAIHGEGTLEILPDGFGFLRSPEANYLPGPGRHLCESEPGAPLWPAHRRFGRRPDPRTEGRRALFRAAQGQQHQFRAAGIRAAPDQFRQPDAALSRRAAEDGSGELPVGGEGSEQGLHAAGDRPDLADRQGPARADRVAAAHRQDGDAAEHRHRDRRAIIPRCSSSCC